VTDGQVAVSSAELANPLKLQRGKALLYNSAASLAETQDIDPSMTGSWRNGELHYRQTPLSLVVLDLDRYAGIRLSVPPELRDRRFTGILTVKDEEATKRDLAQLLGLTLPQAAGRDRIDIPRLPLAEALEVLARQTGLSIGVDGDIPNIRAQAVHDVHGVANALARLLAGTGLEAKQVGSSAWRIVRRKLPPRPISQFASGIEVGGDSALVVTGTKRSLTRFGVPQSLSVLKLMPHDRHDPNRDTAFVASEVEGLNLTALGPGRNRMFLRGVADSPFNDSNQSPVAVALDEIRLTYSAPAPDLRLVDVERVELLKGPQGTLYGLDFPAVLRSD
ncbi:hypothetical protein E4T56_gene3926, partial [Termitomyces sp. T112]